MLKGYYHPYIATIKNTITRATIYYEAEGDTIHFAVAFCSPKDRFSRKLGCTISKGRFDAGEKHSIYGHEKFKDRFEVLENIEANIEALEGEAAKILPHWFSWFTWK